jgi:hypothetical protein
LPQPIQGTCCTILQSPMHTHYNKNYISTRHAPPEGTNDMQILEHSIYRQGCCIHILGTQHQDMGFLQLQVSVYLGQSS